MKELLLRLVYPLHNSIAESFRYVFFTLLLFLSVTSTVCAQSVDDRIIKVIDENSQPVEAALVFNDKEAIQWITNANGLVRLPQKSYDALTFQHISFKTKSLTWAQLQSMDFVVVLEAHPFVLDELTLVGRTNERKEQLLHEVRTIDRREIQYLQPSSTADILEKSGDVFIQRSQMGGGSPIIRGFEANSILLVVDGVRMNNAIYRSGHLQNALSVGPSGLEQIEIVYGPGSLLYGSDALGGVINFRTRNPQWKRHDRNSWTGDAYIRYGTANQEKTLGTSLEWRNEKWASRTSFGISDLGHLRSGSNRSKAYENFGYRNYYVERIDGTDSLLENNNPDIQIGSAYRQWDIFHKTRYLYNKNGYLQLNFQHSNTSDVPRYDQLNDPTRPETQPRFAEWSYGPQFRLLNAVEWNSWTETQLYDKMRIIGAYQRLHETRITRLFQSDDRRTQAEKLNIYSLTADFEKHLNPYNESILKYGVESISNDLNSSAFRENLPADTRSEDILSRYPSEAAGTTQFGAYATYSTRPANSFWRAEAGLRYSYYKVFFTYDENDPIQWPDAFTNGLNSVNQALTGSVAFQLTYSPIFRQRFMVGSAFRAPNIDDIAKIRFKGDEVNVPNVDLKPEQTIQFETTLEANITADRSRLRGAVTLFHTTIDNAIVQANYPLPDGSNTLVVEREAYTTVANVNANSGRISGASLFLERKGKHWGANLRGQYTYGRAMTESGEQPLAHIPPLYGRLAFWYEISRFKWQLTVPMQAAKNLEDYAPNSSDNLEYAPENGTPGWYTINLFTECVVSEHVSAQLSIENILDTHYRTFSSGISAPGRHIAVTLLANF